MGLKICVFKILESDRNVTLVIETVYKSSQVTTLTCYGPINCMPHPPQLGDRVGLTRGFDKKYGPGVGHLIYR